MSMRLLGIWLLIFGFCLCADAQGSGFCDEPIEEEINVPGDGTPRGGGCLQARESYAFEMNVLPDYSDSIPNRFASNDLEPLQFEFDAHQLRPEVGSIEPISVLELSFKQLGLQPGTASENLVLTMSALRGVMGDWRLQFDLLDAPSGWSIVTHAPVAPLSRKFVSAHGSGSLDVRVTPVEGWGRLAISVTSTGSTMEPAQELQFRMPDFATRVYSPRRLRSGALGPLSIYSETRSVLAYYENSFLIPAH